MLQSAFRRYFTKHKIIVCVPRKNTLSNLKSALNKISALHQSLKFFSS